MRFNTVEFARIEREKMTDGSVASNVVFAIGDGKVIRVACPTEDHAFELVACLNGCNWAEVA